MKFKDRLVELRNDIDERLLPLVDRDYRLLEIPDYPNVGDGLIFEGEIQLLRKARFSCRGMSTMQSFATRMPKIPTSELLIFRGGGYFGDLWPNGWGFQKKVLEAYPNNPMLMFPQSVCFNTAASLADAVTRYGMHKNLTICLRDRQSYKVVKDNFPNRCHLVPDLAFYADVEGFRSEGEVYNDTLLISRDDREKVPSKVVSELVEAGGVDIMDWGDILLADGLIERIRFFMKQRPRKFSRIYDWFVRDMYRRYLISRGVGLVDRYENVYSTRLHGCILALMLGKRVFAIDNSYGKIKSLYNTWLNGCQDISMVE